MFSKVYNADLRTHSNEKKPVFYTFSKSIISKIYSVSKVN